MAEGHDLFGHDAQCWEVLNKVLSEFQLFMLHYVSVGSD